MKMLGEAVGWCIVLFVFSSPLWGLFLLCVGLESWTCHAQGRAMHRSVTYGPVQGCIVEAKPGLFLPIENYRVVE